MSGAPGCPQSGHGPENLGMSFLLLDRRYGFKNRIGFGCHVHSRILNRLRIDGCATGRLAAVCRHVMNSSTWIPRNSGNGFSKNFRHGLHGSRFKRVGSQPSQPRSATRRGQAELSRAATTEQSEPLVTQPSCVPPPPPCSRRRPHFRLVLPRRRVLRHRSGSPIGWTVRLG